MYRLDLALRPDLPVHSDFCDWLCEVEEGAAAAKALEAWRGGRGKSTTVYNNSVRLMAFSDTLAPDLLSAAGCSCIVELQGGWNTDSRWGLRWRVVQIKFVNEVSLPPPPPNSPPESAPQAPAAAFAFLDD